MKSLFLAQSAPTVYRVFAPDTIGALEREFGLCKDHVYTKEEILENPEIGADVDYLFSTWSCPLLSAEQIHTCFPRLKAMFYAAGSVQGIARQYLANGAKIFSAWAANGVPVAETTVAQIVLANKGFFMAARYCSRSLDMRGKAVSYVTGTRGNYGARVGIIGVGMIGTMVCERLKQYKLEVVAYDPFCSPEKAEKLGIRLVSLEELFSTCDVISNHLANNAQTKGMLTYDLFSRMKPYAVFLNTGRGAQLVEEDLVRALREKPGACAVLDVTDPEPPVADSPFYGMDNVILTPHLAGSQSDEVHRMAEYMLEEARRLEAGEPLRYSVTEEMLKTMA